MAWRCFLVEHRGEAALYLRRYVSRSDGGECSVAKHGFHNAEVSVGRAPAIWGELEDGYRYHQNPDVEPWLIDYRWPTHCACGRPFTDEDNRQVHHELIYVAADGREWEMHNLPIGAMYYIDWHFRGWVGPDGRCLQVVLPPGRSYDYWMIDGPASSGGRWQRSGTPPDISVTPSIKSGSYHGFLGSSTAPGPGWLSDPLSDSGMLQGT